MEQRLIKLIRQFGLIVIGAFAFITFVIIDAISESDYKYKVKTEYATYRIDTFRVYGSGICFDDRNGKTVYVAGSYSIERKKDEKN